MPVGGTVSKLLGRPYLQFHKGFQLSSRVFTEGGSRAVFDLSEKQWGSRRSEGWGLPTVRRVSVEITSSLRRGS